MSAFELFKDKHGLVIGAMEGVRYRQYELQLEPGSKLFLYIDDVPEATDAENALFGTERMLETLNREPNAEPELECFLMADQLQIVYIIPTADGCIVATVHCAAEAAEGFARRFNYMINTISAL